MYGSLLAVNKGSRISLSPPLRSHVALYGLIIESLIGIETRALQLFIIAKKGFRSLESILCSRCCPLCLLSEFSDFSKTSTWSLDITD
jgi:hypothetical protein